MEREQKRAKELERQIIETRRQKQEEELAKEAERVEKLSRKTSTDDVQSARERFLARKKQNDAELEKARQQAEKEKQESYYQAIGE